MHITGKKFIITKDKNIIRPILSEVDNLRCNNKKIKKLTSWNSSTNLDNSRATNSDTCWAPSSERDALPAPSQTTIASH